MTLDEYLRRLDIRVCCSRDLHRKYWTYRDRQWVCTACARLAEWTA